MGISAKRSKRMGVSVESRRRGKSPSNGAIADVTGNFWSLGAIVIR